MYQYKGETYTYTLYHRYGNGTLVAYSPSITDTILIVDLADINRNPVDLNGELIDINNLINTLNSRVDDLNSQIIAQQIEIDAQAQLLIDLNSTDVDLENQIDDLNSQITVLQGQMVTAQSSIASLDMNVTTIFSDINNIWNTITIMQNDISTLQIDLSDLQDTVELMNHGTINLRFRQDSMTLDVQGEAPIGTTQVRLKMFDSRNPGPSGTNVLGTVLTTTQDSDSKYGFVDWTGTAVDVSSLPPAIYSVEVEFSPLPGSYKVTGIFAELLLLDMNDRIVQLEADVNALDQNVADIFVQLAIHDQNIIDLDQKITDVNNALNQKIDDVNALLIAEVARLNGRINDVNADLQLLRDQVNRMNHGTVYLAYDRDDDLLRVKGEAPEGTVNAIIHIRDADRDELTSLQKTKPVDLSDNSYRYDYLGVNSWDPQIYDVAVEFKDSSNNTLGQWVNAQFYALAVLADFQGFGFVESKNFDSCYRLINRLPINFKFGAITAGNYEFKINVLDSNGNVEYTSSLPPTTTIAKYNSIMLSNSVDLINVATGDWNTVLVATNTTTAEIIESNIFVISIKDSCALMDANIAINTPIVNSITTMPYPYGSYKANVFWTQSGITSLQAQLATNTGVQNYPCEFKYFSSPAGQKDVNGEEVEINVISSGYAGVCKSAMNTSWWDNTNYVDNSTTLRIYGFFVADPVSQYYDLNVGIDNEIPMIYSVIPSANAYDNNILIDVNATDNLSGIASVEIRMIHIDTNIIYPNYWADFNSDTNTFQVTIDTLTLPNGKYDINAIVTDVAGDINYMVVDPVIDHNTPVITGIKVTTSPMIRNNTITVDVNATDVFDSNSVAGIEYIKMSVTDTNSGSVLFSSDMNYVSENMYTVNFDTNTDWNVGTYNIRFDIKDKTVNTVHMDTNDLNVDLLQNYYFNISNQSRQIAAGTTTSFSFDGNFRDDVGSAGPFVDGNVILITSAGVAIDANVEFDANGLYTIKTTSLPVGTHTIDLNYNTTDYNYTDQIKITVTAAPVTTGSGGGFSGSGGVTRDVCGNNICSSTESSETCPSDCGEPDANVSEEPVVNETGPTTPTEPTPTGDIGETGDNLEVVNVEQPTNEQPSGPTGFFGLGEATDLGVGLIGLLAVIAIIVVVWTKRK